MSQVRPRTSCNQSPSRFRCEESKEFQWQCSDNIYGPYITNTTICIVLVITTDIYVRRPTLTQ
eukprot:6042013-Pleurochrysis_carterae.AAC.1